MVTLNSKRDAPMRPLELGVRGNVKESRADGTLYLRHPEPIGSYPRSYTESLVRWAREAPDRVFLAQRVPEGGWRSVTYQQALSVVRSLGQALLDLDLGPRRPLAILSGNTIEHALIGLAALHVGVPYCPVSVPFSLLSRDHAKLKHVLGLLEPGLIFVQARTPFERALRAASAPGTPVVAVEDVDRETINYAALSKTSVGPRVDQAAAAVNGETIAKILFTSGSSAMPKGVLNPHRMLCANQQMGTQVWPFLRRTPPVIVEWLPWNHTFSGNFIFGLNLFHGGTMFIDEGRPMPGQFELTVQNLREVAPTIFFGVPKTFELLVQKLKQDEPLRGNFFSSLQMMFYAAASLPESVWDELRDLSIRTLKQRVFMCSALGSTETAPLAITVNWDADRPNILGLPTPGSELKLVPNDRKLELRIRGPHITPGYLKDPEKTGEAFDEEGFYRIGDAVRFADPDDVDQGLMFDGRIAEDYKLSTGTWVNAGPLRALVCNHLTPLVRDVLPTGHNRDEVGVLVFPEFEACRRLAELPASASPEEIAAHPKVLAEFERRLAVIASEGTSSVNTVKRMLVVAEPLTDVECTDKGTLSFNVVLEGRALDIEALYAPQPSPRVLYAPDSRPSRKLT